MTLPAGSRLGPYEVISPIGAGGMGEVYKARDTRLGREVAVKVLPADFAADAERRRRFEQEARAASALNHPNIVSVFDIGGEGDAAYIAMELVEGQSLRELADAGPISPRRVLDVAAPLASGLARAHAAGIVHRDLKPENVMVSKDGFVKILDFGLAKAIAAPKDGGSQMPTMDPATGAGMVLGTVAYMSPEQAAGRTVDHRSDQFSFATIVYELLSGKKPFLKPTAVETMSAILREDPTPFSQAGIVCPAPLRWIVDRCHAKEADGRYASTLDLARELASLRDHYSELSSVSGIGPPADEKLPRKRVGVRDAAALAAALLLGAAAARLLWRPSPPPPPVLRYLTYAGQDSSPAVSPDGRLLAFSSLRSGKPRIWLEELANGTETALTAGPDGDPRFSPDGSSVIFTHMEQGLGSIYRISVLGGEPRRIVDRAARADWSPDGRRIAFVRVPNPGAIGGTVLVSDADGGGEKTLAAFKDKSLDYPRWSPDGKTLAAARIGSIAPTLEAILLIDPENGRTRALPAATAESSIYGLVWGSADSLVYETTMGAAAPGTANGTSTLWEQAVRGGPPRRVVSLPTTGSALDVLRDGSVVLDQISPRENLRAIPLAGMAAGAPRWLTHGISTDRQPAFSPDGKWVAFSSARNGHIDIWKIALDTGEARRLTEASGTSWDPAFTPDGRSIIFSSNRSGHFEIWKADADGSHPFPVTHESEDCENPDISGDGTWIYFFRFAGKDVGTARIRVDGTGLEFLSSLQGVPELSRDGRFIASTSADGGISIFPISSPKSEIARIPRAFAGGSAGGRYRWLGKTHTLLFLGFDDSLRTAIFTQDVDAPLSPRPFTGLPSDTAVETFDISPDGRMLLTAEQELQANIYALENVPGVKKSSRKIE